MLPAGKKERSFDSNCLKKIHAMSYIVCVYISICIYKNKQKYVSLLIVFLYEILSKLTTSANSVYHQTLPIAVSLIDSIVGRGK